MSPAPVTREDVDALERDLADKNAELSTLEQSLEAARDRRAKLVDLVGEGVDSAPLPLAPLVGAITANLLSVTALWFSYVGVIFLELWAFKLSCAALVVAALFGALASRPGAGGSARALLLRATLLVGVVTLLAVAAGAIRMATGGHRIRF